MVVIERKGVAMKKIMAGFLSVLMLCVYAGTAFAVEKESYKVAPKELDIQQVRKEARDFIRGKKYYDGKQEKLEKLEKEYKERYGGRYEIIDEVGNKVGKYLYNEIPDIDPVHAQNDFKERLEAVRDENENNAVKAFFEVLKQKNKLQGAKDELELAQLGQSIGTLSYDLGKSISLSASNAKVMADGAALKVKEEERNLGRRYEDLNKLLGYEPSARYSLNDETVIHKIGQGDRVLIVPSNMNSEDMAKLKSLYDKKEELDRKEKAEEKRKNSWDTHIDSEKLKEEINLEEIRENYSQAEKNTLLELKKRYINGFGGFIGLDKTKKALEKQKQSLEDASLFYKLGKMSRINYLKAEMEYLQRQNGYYEELFDLYRQVDLYEQLYKEKEPKK